MLERRVTKAAVRILQAKAATIAGDQEFVREGQAAQAKAVVLLENKRVASTDKPLLPIATKGKKVYLSGVAAKAAEATGLIVVADPAQTALAIIRAPAPYDTQHPNVFFGSP